MKNMKGENIDFKEIKNKKSTSPKHLHRPSSLVHTLTDYAIITMIFQMNINVKTYEPQSLYI